LTIGLTKLAAWAASVSAAGVAVLTIGFVKASACAASVSRPV
jgi:hypothetical protein